MKKIILFIICLLLTGCNYQELNDMAIVSLIGIEYKDDNYNLTIEISENKKEQESSLIYHSSASSIEKAIEEASLKIDKNLYFIDLSAILMDTDTANSKLTYILDYLTRDVMFSSNFNMVICDDIEQSINIINKKEKVAGNYIKDIFNNKNNNIIDNKYDNFIKDYLNEFKDIILPYANIDNGEFIINEAVIFHNKKIVNTLNLDMIQSYNLLNNVDRLFLYKIDYKDNNLVFRVSNHDVNIKYDNKIIVEVNINGSFFEIEDIDIEKDTDKILKELKSKINNDITELISTCKIYDSDILKFRKNYFNSERKKINSITDLDYSIKLNIKLDREGLIFNSLGDMYEENK